MSRYASHYSIYLEALLEFTTPATAKQIHEKAVLKFGADNVKGGTESVRTSLRRYMKMGKVASPERGKYEATMKAIDPAMAIEAKMRRIEKENTELKAKVASLEVELSGLRAESGK